MTPRKLIRIEQVMKAAGVSRRTVRSYVEAGIIEESGREGAHPLYDEGVIEALGRVGRLRDELGVNLAGVQVILDMRKKIESLQKTVREVAKFVHDEMGEELGRVTRRRGVELIPRPLAKPPKKID